MASTEEAGRVAGDPVMARKYGSAEGWKSQGMSAHAQEQRAAGSGRPGQGLGARFDHGAADEAAVVGVERALHRFWMAALQEPMVLAGLEKHNGRCRFGVG